MKKLIHEGSRMDTKEAAAVMAEGFQFLCHQARIVAMLPLEEWRDALEHAESVGIVSDPTLLREYLQSDNPRILKSIIAAAIPLKKAVLAAQPLVSPDPQPTTPDPRDESATGGVE